MCANKLDKTEQAPIRKFMLKSSMQPVVRKRTMVQNRKQWQVRKALKEMFHEFCQATSMHGFRFISREESSLIDSILWTFMLIGGIAFSLFFSNLLWISWDESPVLITIESANYPIAANYPFPTVNICNVNRLSRKALQQFLESSEGKKMKMADMQKALEMIILAGTDNKTEIARLSQLLKDAQITSNDHGYESLIHRLTPKCSDMFAWCAWEEDDEDCRVLFKEELTDIGFCCSFNSVIYKKDGSHKNSSTQNLRKARADGVEAGLRVILDAEVDDYNVTSSSFNGFRISVQSVDTYVTTGSIGFLASPGHVLDAAVTGEAIRARESVKRIPRLKRQCAYRSDNRSKYYDEFNYTSAYCELECKVNKLLEDCKCVPYHLPVPNYVPVCNLSSYSCVVKVNKYFIGNTGECGCLDACNDIWYPTQITIGEYPNLVTQFPNSLKTLPKFVNMTETQLTSYAQHNFVKLNVYYKSVNGISYIRDQKTTWPDFISSTGGLLGLGFGFSLLSAAELFYYIFVRWYYYRIREREDQQKALIVALNPKFPVRDRLFLVRK